jgi:phospholipid transport system substrate-binding protein
MSERRRHWAGWLAAMLGLGGAVAALAADAPHPLQPRQIIEQSATQVLAIMRDPKRTREQRIDELRALAYERFDFRTMTRLVLARNWKKLTSEQQDEFAVQLREYLANDYSSRLDRYDQQDVHVLDERQEPRGDVTVRTQMVGGQVDGAIVDYRMRSKDGRWRIIDVVIEGISLVANLRDQFREVLTREGPEKLLEKLREKNAAAGQPPPPGAPAPSSEQSDRAPTSARLPAH